MAWEKDRTSQDRWVPSGPRLVYHRDRSSNEVLNEVLDGPGEKGAPLSQGVRAGRKALGILHIEGMEVRKKRPRGFGCNR